MVRYMSTLLVLLIAVPGFAAAWVRSIHVEWTYTPPIEPEVEGFVLYRGARRCAGGMGPTSDQASANWWSTP